ncbi:MAG: hypothetical protein ACRC67_42920 [Inquilinus sp.]|uniref:hypothetical protein n=1 Tax=Inquilinus sp. TaxID=1932117 RepID=UPI003F40C9AD
MKKRWKFAAGIAAILVAVPAAAYVAVVRPNYPPVPVLQAAAPRNQSEADRQDLELLRKLPEVDRSFSDGARERFDLRIEGLLAEVAAAGPAGMDRARFETAITCAVALAGNGHTTVRGVAMGRSLNTLPLRLVWFDDGLYVVSARKALADLLGARVTALGGRTPEDLADAVRPCIGGNDVRARLLSVSLLSSPAALHALGLLPAADAATLAFDLPDGRRIERRIEADPQPAIRAEGEVRWPASDLLPTALPADDGSWRHVLSGADALPLYLQHADRAYWQDTPAPDTLFVELRQIRDMPDDSLEAFLDRVLAEAAERKPKTVIVDLRANTGGDYMLTAAFTRRLPDVLAPDARIRVLTGPDTFSAAISTLARLKHFGGDRVEIVGRPVGDFTVFWGEGGRLTLPHSGLSIRYATAFHDWGRGCGLAQVGSCFWLNYLYGVAGGELSPTVTVPFTFADYRAGRDPDLEAVAAED